MWLINQKRQQILANGYGQETAQSLADRRPARTAMDFGGRG
jgi:hypothetical protein